MSPIGAAADGMDDEQLAGRDSVNGFRAVSPLCLEEFPANARRLVDARRALEEWATAAGLPEGLVNDIVLAGYEAMANASEHAYRLRPGTLDLLAECSGTGEVSVVVRDRGDWRPPPADPGFRGRGLLMIRSLSRSEITPGPRGTTVRMRWQTGS